MVIIYDQEKIARPPGVHFVQCMSRSVQLLPVSKMLITLEQHGIY